MTDLLGRIPVTRLDPWVVKAGSVAVPGLISFAALTARESIAWWFAAVVVAFGYLIAFVVLVVPRGMDLVVDELAHLSDEERHDYLTAAGQAAAAEREALGLALKDREQEAV